MRDCGACYDAFRGRVALQRRAEGRGALLRLMDRDRARRASAEVVGMLFLVAVVVGFAAQRLSPNNTGAELLTCGRSSPGAETTTVCAMSFARSCSLWSYGSKESR
jgi:hypothetical protein